MKPLLSILVIANSVSSKILSEGDRIYEFPQEYLNKNWTDFVYTNNNDIFNESDTDWCAGLYVSPMFSNNTILQRAPQKSSIFGYGTPDSTITLTFNNKVYTAKALPNNTKVYGLASCTWSVTLPAIDDSNNPNGMKAYNISIKSSITNTPIINIYNISFGDIWICTGQSNMWLPVQHTFSWYNTSINQTCNEYDIRFYHTPNTMSLVPRDARQWQNKWQWYYADYINATNQQLSAVCYYYARHLYDYLSSTVINHVPLGLVDATWGGTIIEAWTSKPAQSYCDWRYCANYDNNQEWGGAVGIYAPYPPCNMSVMSANNQPESLYNGMILPLSNMTVKGMLWYQGENNGWTPGNYLKNQGYACLLPRMIDNWRQTWYLNGNNNGYDINEYNQRYNKYDINGNILPFGVVSLHPWCGEEASNCFPMRNYSNSYGQNAQKYDPTPYNLAWLRWAQIGSSGRAPNNIMPNSFVAQAYDLPDLGGGNLGPPAQYEGGLHPRNKWTLSNRLALASLAIAYKNNSISYSGPILSGCNVFYNTMKLILIFDKNILNDRNDEIIMKYNNGVQIQTSNTFNGWFDVNITYINGNNVTVDLSNILNNNKLFKSKNRIKRSFNLDKIEYVENSDIIVTGVRYAWSDMPCCPVALIDWPQRIYNFTCEEAQCALYTKKYDLPAVPFIYQLNKIGQIGNCLIPTISNNM